MPLPPLVIMGVSGSGKSTVAAGVAERVEGAEYLDADDYHPPANKAKMSAGIPLDDVDRAPWLTAVGRAMRDAVRGGTSPVMACSALRHAHRVRILAEEPGAFFVLLDVGRDELERRVHARQHHFMPASLLDSQLATLEPLTPDEPGATLHVAGESNDIVDRVLAAVLHAR